MEEAYHELKKVLKQLEEAFKKLGDWDSKRLTHDAKIHQLSFANTSLLTLARTIYKWGEELEKFVCAIDNKENCETSSKDWEKKRNESPPVSQALGQTQNGQASAAALQQLQESRKVII
ncbi:hypothetical protein [Candidatus Mycoplasma haematominutum]|uniref:Uncharacterized protein n=1 Tax=Candidatus Mycoplasma haematominutum 'Birmingham 1' TaxID=1116213 RepID=G8C3E3_9MOLU|nr:hypothetical protein [Candidatus Mycoplasma haematominutum]CCE66841.1 hypothetical protein MHM_03230 [Candidatus Mycoplasma haematominutum 'Birmingham 1']